MYTHFINNYMKTENKDRLKNIKKWIMEVPVNLMNFGWDILDSFLDRLWNTMDKGKITRRLTVYITTGMNLYAFIWVCNFVLAEFTGTNGADIAMIIGAIMTPLSALNGYVFKRHSMDSRKENSRDDT